MNVQLKNILIFSFQVLALSTPLYTMSQNNFENYNTQLEQWHNQREQALKSEKGWLTVSGLYWLKSGINTIGSDSNCTIVFPKNNAAEQLGFLSLQNDEVYYTAEPNSDILLNGKPFEKGKIFDLNTDEESLVITHRNLRWFIIKRGNKYALRLRDLDNDARRNFKGINRFPANKSFIFNAKLEVPQKAETIAVPDIIGNITETPLAGYLTFTLAGQVYKLEATLEGQNDLFIVFSDYTSGHSTYGAGRFLYAKKMPNENTVLLDFNKAYNPPCAFTNFATCPLPREQNKLKVEINAGELKYEHD